MEGLRLRVCEKLHFPESPEHSQLFIVLLCAQGGEGHFLH